MARVLSERQAAEFQEQGFVGPVRILAPEEMAERRERLDALATCGLILSQQNYAIDRDADLNVS